MSSRRISISRPAAGDAFVGREELLEEIREDLFRAEINISIVGIGRIGKSSLACKIVEEANRRSDRVAVRLDLQSYSSAKGVLFDLNAHLIDSIVRLGIDSPRNVIPETFDELLSSIRSAVRCIRRNGVMVSVIVDEFDNIKNVEGGDLLCRVLRSHGNDTGPNHFTVVTVSRRPVSTLEATSADISNLDGILKKHYVRFFERREALLLIDKYSVNDWISSKDLDVFDAVGYHPMLISMLIDKCCDVRDMRVELLELYHERVKYYEVLDRFLNDIAPSLIGSIAAYVAGYRQGSQNDLSLLRKYGLINDDESRCYTMSFEYSRYLANDQREYNTAALWNRFERAMREAIERAFDDRYGPEWRRDETLQCEILPGMKSLKERMERARCLHLDDQRAVSPLYFCYPRDYWQIVKSNRKVFERTFSGVKDLGAHFDRVIWVRNPTQHNWLDQVDRQKHMEAEASLRILLSALSNPSG